MFMLTDVFYKRTRQGKYYLAAFLDSYSLEGNRENKDIERDENKINDMDDGFSYMAIEPFN